MSELFHQPLGLSDTFVPTNNFLLLSSSKVKTHEGDVEDLGLTFSTTDDFFGLTTQHALLPGHANTPVTNDNRLLYCHLLVRVVTHCSRREGDESYD